MKERLRYLLKAKGLNQTEFAEAIGTTQNAITNYVTGRRNPSSSVINNICKTFNVNESWLKDGIGDPFIEIEEDAELAEWCAKVLTDEDFAMQKRCLSFLKQIKKSDVDVLKQLVEKANEILNDPSLK